jgi:hypothetical protein
MKYEITRAPRCTDYVSSFLSSDLVSIHLVLRESMLTFIHASPRLSSEVLLINPLTLKDPTSLY